MSTQFFDALGQVNRVTNRSLRGVTGAQVWEISPEAVDSLQDQASIDSKLTQHIGARRSAEIKKADKLLVVRSNL